jgi:xanthine/CO dehydrogenase XdhC/CoxF family maturation factor
MTLDFHEKLDEMKRSLQPFAVATIINVRGSASAKPGSKAILDRHGQNVWGWVGGGCAESFVGRQSVEAIEQRRVRIVQADLDDEIFGLGMPCGGVMDVFIDPQLPPQLVEMASFGVYDELLVHLASTLHLELRLTKPAVSATGVGQVLVALAYALSSARGATADHLRRQRAISNETPQRFERAHELLILGHSRITEELARLAVILKWPVRVFAPAREGVDYPPAVVVEVAAADYMNLKVHRDSMVVVASHHKGDAHFIQRALAASASYIGMIASPKRAALVFVHLREQGLGATELSRVFAPAGLDLQCQSPAQIALSCIAELLLLQD